MATTTRTVTIPAGEYYSNFAEVTVTLPWVCLHCGGPRGEPYDNVAYDGFGLPMKCHGWTNPCGHFEKYSDVRASIQPREVA